MRGDFFKVPRFEKERSVSYFFTRYPFDERDEDIGTAPLMIAIGESFVLTVMQRPVPFAASNYAFWGIVGLTGLSVVAIAAWFHKSKWL